MNIMEVRDVKKCMVFYERVKFLTSKYLVIIKFSQVWKAMNEKTLISAQTF